MIAGWLVPIGVRIAIVVHRVIGVVYRVLHAVVELEPAQLVRRLVLVSSI
jgi:hypothetical protein